MSLALFSLGAYVSAEAYAQARGASAAASAACEIPQAAARFEPSRSVYFRAGESALSSAAALPYRTSSLFTYPQATLPQHLVDYLLNQASFTGQYYSLFRHGPAWDPEVYEIRPGSPESPDRSALGGTSYDAAEERFFDIAWVAHVHPPQKSPLPSFEDLDAVAERARLNGRRIARHSLFGFLSGQPACVELQAIHDPILGGISMLHRASPRLSAAADARIQEWLDWR